jgi:hypothetical protein
MLFDLNTRRLRLWITAAALGIGAMTFSAPADARGFGGSPGGGGTGPWKPPNPRTIPPPWNPPTADVPGAVLVPVPMSGMRLDGIGELILSLCFNA